MTTNDNECKGMTTSSTTSDKEWYNKWQRVTTDNKVRQRITMSGYFGQFPFFERKLLIGTFKPWGKPWGGPIELRANVAK